MDLELAASRTYPAGVARSFDAVLAAPLSEVFDRRYAALPAVRGTRDQRGSWDTPGATRTIVLTDGGTLHETLTGVDRPHSFGYRLTDVTGPMKLIVSAVTGGFRFESAGTGVRITWTWSVEPRGAAGRAAMPAFARMWGGYARQGLERIEHLLLG